MRSEQILLSEVTVLPSIVALSCYEVKIGFSTKGISTLRREC